MKSETRSTQRGSGESRLSQPVLTTARIDLGQEQLIHRNRFRFET